jgi:hypothetical protein
MQASLQTKVQEDSDGKSQFSSSNYQINEKLYEV